MASWSTRPLRSGPKSFSMVIDGSNGSAPFNRYLVALATVCGCCIACDGSAAVSIMFCCKLHCPIAAATVQAPLLTNVNGQFEKPHKQRIVLLRVNSNWLITCPHYVTTERYACTWRRKVIAMQFFDWKTLVCCCLYQLWFLFVLV